MGSRLAILGPYILDLLFLEYFACAQEHPTPPCHAPNCARMLTEPLKSFFMPSMGRGLLGGGGWNAEVLKRLADDSGKVHQQHLAQARRLGVGVSGAGFPLD